MKKNHKKGVQVRERFFGAYRQSGDWHIIDWSDCNEAKQAELQKCSEVPVLSGFFPVPFPGFVLDSRVTESLIKANSAFAADMYADCDSAYIVSMVNLQDESIGIIVSQLKSWEDLRVAVENAALAGDGKGAWIRLVFVYRNENGITTQAEDVFLLEEAVDLAIKKEGEAEFAEDLLFRYYSPGNGEYDSKYDEYKDFVFFVKKAPDEKIDFGVEEWVIEAGNAHEINRSSLLLMVLDEESAREQEERLEARMEESQKEVEEAKKYLEGMLLSGREPDREKDPFWIHQNMGCDYTSSGPITNETLKKIKTRLQTSQIKSFKVFQGIIEATLQEDGHYYY